MIEIIDLSTLEKRELREGEKTVLCLGNFDGVHVAHAALIREVRALKMRISGEADGKTDVSCGAFFFSDHPRGRISGVRGARLTSTTDKLGLFQSMGLDIAVIADFDELRNLTPEKFVHTVLHGECAAVGAVCGYNFRFGKGGSGDAVKLCELFGDKRCVIVSEVRSDGGAVSSSAVRSALRLGEVERAARLLGRNFSLSLDVVAEGTATFARLPQGMAVPAEAKYEVEIERSGATLRAECVISRVGDETECRILGTDVASGRAKIAFIRKI